MSDEAVFLVMVTARALHYAAALVLFGYCIFKGCFVGGAVSESDQRIDAQVMRGGAVLFVLTTVLWFGAEAANAGDGWQDAFNFDILKDVLLDTGFGLVWTTQFLSAAALGILALRKEASLQRLAAILAGLALIALANIGHAVSLGGALDLMLPLGQAVHLLACGFWMGGLAAIALKPKDAGTGWRSAFMDFSYYGHFAVGLTLLSGLFMSLVLLRGQGMSWDFDYVLLLGGKIGIVLVMTGLALFNRYAVVPMMKHDPQARLRLQRITRLNFACSVIVVVLVSLLGVLSPFADSA